MTEGDEDLAALRAMPNRRTANGRFAKGFSGNPSGRPRTKHQRAASTRQQRRDTLAITEELVAVKTKEGTKLVPFYIANLMAIRSKASQGHAPSQRLILKLHREALEEHELVNRKLHQPLEQREADAVDKGVDGLSLWAWRNLNLFRKLSWRL